MLMVALLPSLLTLVLFAGATIMMRHLDEARNFQSVANKGTDASDPQLDVDPVELDVNALDEQLDDAKLLYGKAEVP